jgi:hypothetical protein
MAKFEGSIISDLIYHEWGITEMRAVVEKESPKVGSSNEVQALGLGDCPKPNAYDIVPGTEV